MKATKVYRVTLYNALQDDQKLIQQFDHDGNWMKLAIGCNREFGMYQVYESKTIEVGNDEALEAL